MPLDGNHVFDERDDQRDDESLFGSPPPSPGTGRSWSLALPSGGLDSEQNVGTLALPGSHNPSKLAVDSAVSLLDACHHHSETQPSRASTPAQATSCATSSPSMVTDPNTGSRPSRQPSGGPPKKRKRTKKSSNTTSTPTPGPSIQLPPSDTPVPPNFLRNQQALLGIAGLVANINPASLSTRRYNKGNGPNNPIVVEDGVTLSRPGYSTAPTPAQLLTTLSTQKELFPVLEQLLNILRRGLEPPADTPSTSNLPQPPVKKRKLSQVPAGAVDWDVPFPFPPGEGPPNYKERWTNERCERLISDFITLLREGASKATARASAKQATSQPAAQSCTQSHSTSSRWSVPPIDGNRYSPPSNYVPLPLDVYLRPTPPHNSEGFLPTRTTTELPDPSVDLLASIFGAVMPLQDDHLSDLNTFDQPTDSLPQGFDIDPLLLDLMGTGPSQEGLGRIGSPTSSTEEASTPALSHSPGPSRSITSGPSPMTPNFDSSFATPVPSPLDSRASQRDRAGISGSAPHLEPQDGMELGIDVDGDFSRVFGIGEDVACEPSMTDRPPHFCDTSRTVFPTFPGAELSPREVEIFDPAILLSNMHATNTPLPSAASQGVSDIPAFFSPQHDSVQSSSNVQQLTPTTTLLQRQRPVPKRPTGPIPPSKSKAATTLAVAKKRREDAIQEARDLRRHLVADIGKSKVQLWELTMEQGVLTRMSKDERLKRG